MGRDPKVGWIAGVASARPLGRGSLRRMIGSRIDRLARAGGIALLLGCSALVSSAAPARYHVVLRWTIGGE